MIFVDTGYFFALLHPRDELRARAVGWKGCLSEKLLTTEYVLWELPNSSNWPNSRRKAHAAVDAILSSSEWQVVSATPDLFAAGRGLHRQHIDKEWSLTDCISFFVMRDRSVARALTHDHHFEQAGFEALLRRDPP